MSSTLHTLGTADTGGDVPQAVRVNTANAEARAVVQQMLGLRMVQLDTTQDVVVQRIENRVFSLIDEARSSISRQELRDALNANLTNALRQIRPQLEYGTATENQRVQAVAQAVYESIPSDVIYQIGVMSSSANFAIANGVPTSVVEIAGAPVNGADPVRINLDHPFWRQQDFRNAGEISAALTGRRGAEVGLQTPRTRNHQITAAEAAALVAQNFDSISVAPTNRPNRTVNAVTPTAGGPAFNFTVRMDALIRGSTTADAPAGLQNRRIAELTSAEVRTILEYRGAAGNFPYWTQFVEPSNGHNPTEVVTVGGGAPTPLSDVAFTEIAAVAGAGSLGLRSITLLDAHTDVRAEHARLQALMDRLMTGSENQAGAAVALSLAASNPNVMNVATQQAQEARVLADLNRARARLELSTQLKNLGDMNLNFKFQTMPLGAPATLDAIIAEETALRDDISNIGTGTTWNSEFCRNAGLPLPNTYTSPNDRRDITTRLQAQLREVTEERGRYNQMLNVLRRVTQAAVASETYASSPRLSALMTAAGNPQAGAIAANTNNVADAATIRNEARLPTDADITADITRNEGLLQRARAGGDTGDLLQQRIFQEHFRREGLSTADAEKSANYLYARSLLDDELTTQHQVLINDLFDAVDHGPEDTKLENKGRNTLRHLTATMGINAQNNNAEPYDWESASYRQLVTAYFAMKKVYEGGAGQSISAPGSHAVQNEMRRVAEVMSRRHAQMILNDMGNNLSEEDRKNLGSRKALTTETYEKFLTGDAPAKYQPRIDAVLHATEGRVYRSSFWGSRTGRILSGTGRIAKTGGGVALYAGAKTFGAANTAKNLAWSQRKNIATLALFTALGGPLGVAAWGGMKMMEGGNTPAASSGH